MDVGAVEERERVDVEAVIHTLNTAMYTYYRHKNFIVKADQNDATSQHAHIEQKHNELLHGRRRKERKERKKKKAQDCSGVTFKP